MLLNMVFDELLRRLRVELSLTAIAFADDLVLLSSGVDGAAMESALQSTLNITVAWGVEAGLQFSREKTIAIQSSRRNKP